MKIPSVFPVLMKIIIKKHSTYCLTGQAGAILCTTAREDVKFRKSLPENSNNRRKFIMTIKDWKHPGLFAAGVLFGTAGIKALSSKDAKKLYTNCTAAVLRAKKVVMDTVTTIQENAEDIYADAKQINEEREAAEEAVEDVAEETAEEAVEAEAEDTVEA